MEQSVYLAVESYFDLEAAQAETGVGFAAVLEAETTVEAQVETGLPAALDTETVLEEDYVIEAESLETGESVIEEFMFEVVESESDLEAEDTTEESNLDIIEHEAGVVGPEAETAVEGDMIGESIYEAMESDHDDLEVQVETGLPAALDTETVLEEGNVIESESLVTVEADAVVETAESMIEGFSYEAVESESDLEAEYAITEPNSDEEHEADVVGSEAETAVEEDMIGESVDAAESGDELDAEAAAEDIVEEEDVVEDVVEEADDVVEEEEDFVEESEHDVIGDPLESGNNLQAEAESEALVEEGAAMEESSYEPLVLASNSDLQAEASADRAVSIEMCTFKAQEPYFDFEPEEPEDDLSDEQSDSCDEEWDSDAEEVDMDSSDSDRTEEEEDDDEDEDEDEDEDVVVSFLKSSTISIRNRAWKSLVPAWAKLPIFVTDTTTATIESDHSSLVASFLGCGPVLMLQECGNAVMNVIETLLCELSRIRNDLRRVLDALFRQKENAKHA